MRIKNTLFLLAILPTSFALHAEPANVLDAKGHVVLQDNADGSKTTTTYDQNGNVIRNETGIEKRFEFDSKGNSSKTNGGQKP